MKILHLITRLILGGAQENTVLSCLGQVQRGHEVTLAFGPIFGPEGSLLERAQNSGSHLVEIPSMVRELNPAQDLRCYRACRKLIRDLKPDVVHTHSSKAGILGRAAAWAERAPVVVHTIHGLPFHPYQSRRKNAIYVAAERYAARRCHKLVCVADAMRRQALAAGVGRPDQYQVVYSGMEVEPFMEARQVRTTTRAKLGLKEHEIAVGTVARLAELKGHDDLLDALPPLLERHPEVKLLWVGDGWWRPRLEERIRALNLTDRIILTGLVPPEEVPRLMGAMDVLVHPSYREGLPRTLPQALLTRVPVVSYDCDGAGEVCMDGETGRLVRTGDLPELAEAVAWMVEHPEERQAMAERGQDLCRTRFDWRVMVDDLDRLYHQLREDLGHDNPPPAL